MILRKLCSNSLVRLSLRNPVRLMSSNISADQTQILDDGTKINYCTSGTGGHIVLLLPGALGTGRTDFAPQLENLNASGKLTLVAWDPPGYGKSRPPERTFPPNFFQRDAEVAMKFMTALGHEKFSLLGWSGKIKSFNNL